MTEPMDEKTERNGSEPKKIEALKSLRAYVAQYPDEGWRKRHEYVVYSHPGSRFRIQVELQSDIGRGYWRREELAEQGFSDSCLDAKEFAAALMETLFDHTSPHEMWQIIAALQGHLDAWQARRMEDFNKTPELWGEVPPKMGCEGCDLPPDPWELLDRASGWLANAHSVYVGAETKPTNIDDLAALTLEVLNALLKRLERMEVHSRSEDGVA